LQLKPFIASFLDHFHLQQLPVQGFAESLQHCIRPQSSVTALYGSFSAPNLPLRKLLSSEV